MKKLTLDFETKSLLDVKKVGAWEYSEHPTTDVWCLAVKEHGKSARVWWPTPLGFSFNPSKAIQFVPLAELFALLEEADIIEAHNAEFERAIWTNVMAKKYGWPAIPFKKWRCSAAKAAACALPRALGDAGAVLGLEAQKDAEGHRLMLKWTKPRKPRKGEVVTPDENGLVWQNSPEEFERLLAYNLRDVEAEEALSDALPDLPPAEQEVWRLDQRINERGVQVDVEACRRIIQTVEDHGQVLEDEFKALTDGAVESPRQVALFQAWLLDTCGVSIENMQKATILDCLKRDDLPDKARRALEIRKSLSKSSVAKYGKLVNTAGDDGRVRGMFLYHGANPGRWSGRGTQPQNLPRGTIDLTTDEAIEEALSCLSDRETAELCYGDPMALASSAIRGMFIAKEGHLLYAADYKSVEAVGLAWGADEQSALDVFRSGRDNYKVAASGIFGISYDKVDKKQRQVGKVSELALGYGGGIGAYASMAAVYGVDLEQLPEYVMPLASRDEIIKAERRAKFYLAGGKAQEDQLELDEEIELPKLSFEAAVACDIIKQKWREKRPLTVQFWKDLEVAAKNAIMNPGTVFEVRDKAAFKVQGHFLMMRLPSGRCLRYFHPTISEKDKSIRYWGVNSTTKQWMKQSTYGGKLSENWTQAICRDLLTHGMRLAESLDFRIVLHVHDEIVVEEPVGGKTFNDFLEFVKKTPAWAGPSFPLGASGWSGKHYRKD